MSPSPSPPVDSQPVDFDSYATDYSDHLSNAVRFSGRPHRFFVEAKVRHILASLQSQGLDPKTCRALDVGCGTGETDVLLADEFAELHGVDLSKASIEMARSRQETRKVVYAAYDGTRLPYETGRFDFAFAITVMHHVPPANWPEFVAEMQRVVRPGGFVAIYEHNPWNPGTRWVVFNCEFDRDAVLLGFRTAGRLIQAAGMSIALREHILLLPWRNRFAAGVESFFRSWPLGAQYAVYGRVPPPACAN